MFVGVETSTVYLGEEFPKVFMFFPFLVFLGRSFPTCSMFTYGCEKVAIWTHLCSFVFASLIMATSQNVWFSQCKTTAGRLFYQGSAVLPSNVTHPKIDMSNEKGPLVA